MSRLGRTYDALPRPGQTLALNLFGVRNRLRMSTWARYIASIEHTERMAREDQIRFTADRLKEILAHALATVPRYEREKPLLARLEDPAADVYSVLREFPVITKQEVLADPGAFRSGSPGGARIVRTITSGTTGTPFATWMDIGTSTRTDALWWRRNVWSGHRSGEWIARIVGDPIVPLADADPRDPWRVSWVDRRIYLSSFHLRRDAARSYLDVLEKRRPEYIQGYPSSLEVLAGFALADGRELSWRPKAVWYSSEPMFEHQRDVVSRAFRAPIVGLFGSAERIVSAAQCEEGRFHLSLVDGYLEGQFGLIGVREPALVTTLMNRVMPLIRFELGDDIHPVPGVACECGRTLPVMEPVITKHEDWVETPSGRRVVSSVLTWAFKDVAGVRRSQVVQVDGRTIEVHVDADEADVATAGEILAKRLDEMLFGEMEIRIVRDLDIHVMESGKSKFVVRKC